MGRRCAGAPAREATRPQQKKYPSVLGLDTDAAGGARLSEALRGQRFTFHQVDFTDLRSAYLMMRALIPLLRASSVLLNVSTVAGLLSVPNTAVYSVSKAGLITLSKVAAAELAPRVRVNVICSGPIHMPMPLNFGKDLP